VKVVGRKVVFEFAATHPDARTPLDDWHRIVKTTNWKSIAEVRKVFPHADFVDPCTVFNIGGNKYRLVAHIDYRAGLVQVKCVLTHKEYDKGWWKQ